MDFKSTLRKGAEIGVAIACVATLILAGCGGGGKPTKPQPPKFLHLNIAQDAVGVPINTKLILTFDKPVAYCFTCLRFAVGSCPTCVFQPELYGSASWGHTESGVNVEYAVGQLIPFTRYNFAVGGATGLDGSIDFGPKTGPYSFTTGSVADIIPPTVSGSYPSGSGLGLNTTITATFDKTLDSTSINSSTFTLSSASNLPVSGVVTFSGVTATFKPQINLSPMTSYSATITTGVRDAIGNQLATNYSWQFITGPAPDTKPPTVLTTTPSSNATGVLLKSAISAQFSEAIALSGTSSFVVNDASANIPGTAVVSGNQYYFSPTSVSLRGNKLYTATISGITDLSGNLMAPYTWQFTTIPLLVTSISPYLNSTNVGINSSIIVYFDRTIDASTVTPSSISISPPITGTVTALGLPGPQYSLLPPSAILFKPSTPLQSNVRYSVTVANTVTDTMGVPIASNYSWNFTTAPPIQPVVVNVSPGSGGVAQSALTPIVATFNKSLNSATCNTATFAVSGVVGTVTCVGNVATFQPTSLLTTGTIYTGTITTGLKDFEGFSLPANYVWNFSTRTAYIPPYVIGSSHSGSWNTPTVFNVEFSLPMQPLVPANFSFSPSVAGTVSTSGNLATFTSSAPLAPETAYSLNIIWALDTAGNTQTPYTTNFISDTGIVEPVEGYSAVGANCPGSLTPNSAFSVYARNRTGAPKDITICINNQSSFPPPCQTYPNVAVGATTPLLLSYGSNGMSFTYAPSYACWSSGDYTISWNNPGAPAANVNTDKYKSTNWTPNSTPPVNPCFMGNTSVPVAGCQIPPATPPVPSTPTANMPSATYTTSVSPATSPDANGCYVPPHNPDCLVIEKLVLKTDGTGVARLRNNCPQRLYATFCFQRTNLSWECGADGVMPGSALPWWTYGSNGNFVYQYTGSTKWASDWVCHSSSLDPNLIKVFP